MHVLVATDGSEQALSAAQFLKSLADPSTIEKVSVIAVVRPLAAVPFASESNTNWDDFSFRRLAEEATESLAKEFAGWGPEVTTHVWSGSPSAQIIRAAEEMDAGLIVLASRSSAADTVLVGSVAHRVINHATCPVLVVRPGKKPGKRKR